MPPKYASGRFGWSASTGPSIRPNGRRSGRSPASWGARPKRGGRCDSDERHSPAPAPLLAPGWWPGLPVCATVQSHVCGRSGQMGSRLCVQNLLSSLPSDRSFWGFATASRTAGARRAEATVHGASTHAHAAAAMTVLRLDDHPRTASGLVRAPAPAAERTVCGSNCHAFVQTVYRPIFRASIAGFPYRLLKIGFSGSDEGLWATAWQSSWSFCGRSKAEVSRGSCTQLREGPSWG